MNDQSIRSASILGVLLCIGLLGLGFQVGKSIVAIKTFERTVTVKGLSEREVNADTAIWPITFNEAGNDLNELFSSIQKKNALITAFLIDQGFPATAIAVAPPGIVDKQAQGYSGTERMTFRYSANSTITVYTEDVPRVRMAMQNMVELGKEGIALAGRGYQTQTEFLFTALNRIKPDMIQEATQNAREVATKFAKDSQSRLGKIKQARQGQFSINNRDSNTPHIKRVRVVSTITYYLSD
jgi:uncharacterized protein